MGSSQLWDYNKFFWRGEGFFNVGVELGLFEHTGIYRVCSMVHNVNKSWKNSKDNKQTSDEKDQLAYKEMYLGIGYIFWSKLTSWKLTNNQTCDTSDSSK